MLDGVGRRTTTDICVNREVVLGPSAYLRISNGTCILNMGRPMLQNTTAQRQGATFISVPEVENFSREKILETDTSKLYTVDANGSNKPELCQLSRKEFPPGPLEKSRGQIHSVILQLGEFQPAYEAASPILITKVIPGHILHRLLFTLGSLIRRSQYIYYGGRHLIENFNVSSSTKKPARIHSKGILCIIICLLILPILLHSNLLASDTLTSLLSSEATWRPTLLKRLNLGVSLLFILDLWNICNSIFSQLPPLIILVSLTGYFPSEVTIYRIHPGFSCTSEVPLYWRFRIRLVTDRFVPNNMLVWSKVCSSSSLRTLGIMLN
jgi:hypothetical protein